MHENAIVMIDYFMTNEALSQYVGKQMRQMRLNAQLSQQQLSWRIVPASLVRQSRRWRMAKASSWNR